MDQQQIPLSQEATHQQKTAQSIQSPAQLTMVWQTLNYAQRETVCQVLVQICCQLVMTWRTEVCDELAGE